MRPTTQWLGTVSATALIVMSSTPAMAVGTTAGDSITNNVTVSYEVGGIAQTDVTDSDTFTVDRRVNVDVTFVGGTVSVSPGENQAELAFDVTNLSNDTIDLDLSTALTGGTAANISNIEIYLDADGDRTLSAAELAAGPITFLDEVLADDGTGTQTIEVIVVGDIDVGAVNGDTFDVTLTADAHAAGAAGLGAELTATAGANTAGVDTVLFDGAGATDGANQGDDSDTGDFFVSGAQVSVVKSSRIVSDPVNGTTNPKAIPEAVIEYCIAVTNASGGATATAVNVVDDLPFDVSYLSAFGIFVDGTATVDDNSTPADPSDDIATCAADGVAGGSFSAGTGSGGEDQVSGGLSDIAAGVTRALYFRVTIN
ncbi:hypothetical protein [Erythrobacter sp. JK5]|uniref:hypothetical protein n=1 Tax=Erythrobacter sp. JK5 TaxID=2829500 RepID=UPI001BAA399B|nr:hypothetical protein [Erythrobacter sp. JK5]QUL38974.1 hypothetical protein KDC96_06400 [Erythrobacter sp. JK5]